MKKILILFLFSLIFLVSCSKIRDSAGVNRKNIDEFRVVENPPLEIPPDFNLLPPDQISEINIDDVENDLAKEILFGLEQDSEINNTTSLSTMESILNQTNLNDTSNNIRKEIDELFASEKNANLANWNDEIEILDSIAESERLRNELLGINEELNAEVPKIKVKNNKKKKKRFLFF